MKNHRFLWLRNRTTNNRKCEKARNIKEKRTIEMFSTVSKKQEERASSQRDNYGDASKRCKTCNYRVLQFVELAEKYRIGTSLQLNCNVLATNRKKKFFKDAIHKDSIFFYAFVPATAPMEQSSGTCLLNKTFQFIYCLKQNA